MFIWPQIKFPSFNNTRAEPPLAEASLYFTSIWLTSVCIYTHTQHSHFRCKTKADMTCRTLAKGQASAGQPELRNRECWGNHKGHTSTGPINELLWLLCGCVWPATKACHKLFDGLPPIVNWVLVSWSAEAEAEAFCFAVEFSWFGYFFDLTWNCGRRVCHCTMLKLTYTHTHTPTHTQAHTHTEI